MSRLNPSTIAESISGYFSSIWDGLRSMGRSFSTALPYLINVRSGELKKEVTEQYPDPISSRGADELPAKSRGLLQNDIQVCTGCKACEVACPVQCISVETEPSANPNKLWVSIFDIDFSRCVFCGLCVDVCEPGSLTHSRRFEGSALTSEGLISSFGKGRITPEQRAKWTKQRKQKEFELEEEQVQP